MPEIGTEPWVAALDEALRVAAADGPAPGGHTLVIQHEIVESGAAWYLETAGNGFRAASGRHPAPDLTFSWQSADAASVAAGEASALDVLQAGRLRLRGDVNRLRDARPLFEALAAGGV